MSNVRPDPEIRSMGAIPAKGQWIKLAVPASQVGLEGQTVKGMAFTLYNGRVTWDKAGKTSTGTTTSITPVTYYVHSDHLNTPRVLSDSTNKVIWSWASDPFGSTATNEDPDGDGVKFTYNLRFPGQYYDRETGLHYNYFRDYDPRIGRYVESDPIGLKGGVNTYTYVEGNPISRKDPLGLKSVEDCYKRVDREVEKCRYLYSLTYNGCIATCAAIDRFCPLPACNFAECKKVCDQADSAAGQFCTDLYFRERRNCEKNSGCN